MLTNIYEINQAELKQLYSFGIKNKSNILIFGAGGVGKTEIAKQACASADFEYRYINLSVLEAPDLVGLPQISKGNKTVYAVPEFLPLKEEGKKPIVLIVDELDKAADEVESPMLELFQFHSINGRPLNIQAIIATGNLPNERAKSKLVSHVLANRCMIYKMNCEFAPWRDWALQEGKINPLVVAFLDKRPDLLLKAGDEKDPTAYCHPSPRSWSLGSHELTAYLDSLGKSDDDLINDPIVDFGYKIMAGRVGVKAALDFKIWIKHYRTVEPVIESLLNNGEYPSNLSTDHMMIVILGCLNKIKTALMEDADQDLIDNYISNVYGFQLQENIAPDICLAAGRSVWNKALFQEFALTSYPEIKELYMGKIRNIEEKLK